ncbi:GntR family transcriptional regulator [Deinococcus navajonensis]|uniref:GntR family transcriptional regulator n=1 Tax=Deinococcus navajonensis TaxID=309884 RepID=A0ABV8XJ74_9DEIO
MALLSPPADPPSTTTQRVYLALRRDIERGVLAPGVPLDLTQLASQHAVSKIPVREALRQLDAEGLVQLHPRRPATVRTLDGQALHELYELRVLLEISALKYAMPQYTEAHRARLQGALHQLLAQQDPSRWADHDARIHDMLYAPADRPRLLSWIRQLRLDVDRYRVTHLMVTPRVIERQNHEMSELVLAAAGGDASRAVAALRAHLRGAMRVFIRGVQAAQQSQA